MKTKITPVRFLIISGAVFLSILVACIVALLNSDETFMGSLFPEVFGFALEGLIIVSVISFIQLWLDKQRKQEEAKKLKDALRSIAGFFISSCNLIAFQHGSKIKIDTPFDISEATIEKLTNELSVLKVNEKSESVIELVLYIKSHRSQFEAALPIAARIDGLSTHSWSAFLTHINNVDENNESNFAHIYNALECLRWLGISE